jgi:WXG100 family type VII secretion target
MGRFVRLNYDELRTIIKMFRDEGEDIIQLHTALRDRVRDLHKDWEGEGAKKFFGEMENELLPALSRLSKALFFTQDTLQKITKIIQDSDEDTKRFFNGDFNTEGFPAGRQTPSMDFGNMMGSGLTEGANAAISGGVPFAISGGVPIPFPNVGDVGAQPGPPEAPAAGQAQGAAAGAGVAAHQGAGAGGGGGGGAGGQAGQGLQGGLGSMGGGVGGAAGGSGGSAAGGGAAGGGAQAPDHIYEGSAGGGAGGAAQTAQGGAGAGGGAAQGASGGEGAAAAGGAGVAGTAAAGGAGKALKGRVTKKKK